jgi:hypothetical protein
LPPIPAGSTLFQFSHPLFAAPEARFVLGTDGKPCMGMKLGTLAALVPLQLLVEEFGLRGSADETLLQTVIAGLKFVRVIRPGDSIPRELLDGTASWRVDDQHLEIAQGRVTLQLHGWLGGQERLIVDPVEILQLVEDPAVQAKVQGGYPKLAERLGLAGDKEVRLRADRLARELAYIEALRGRFGAVRLLQDKLAAFRRVYRRDKTLDEELIRVGNLILKPLSLFDLAFADVDGNLGEISGVLANIDASIKFIREARDALHARLLGWDEILARWYEVRPEISAANEALIRELYRFLARNYLNTQSW